jgi:hypothetical protein
MVERRYEKGARGRPSCFGKARIFGNAVTDGNEH